MYYKNTSILTCILIYSSYFYLFRITYNLSDNLYITYEDTNNLYKYILNKYSTNITRFSHVYLFTFYIFTYLLIIITYYNYTYNLYITYEITLKLTSKYSRKKLDKYRAIYYLLP